MRKQFYTYEELYAKQKRNKTLFIIGYIALIATMISCLTIFMNQM